jgi:hypothetical protein
MSKTVYVVHCIDTEGPLVETASDTISRVNEIFNVNLDKNAKTLRAIQDGSLNLGGIQEDVWRVVDPKLLKYNENWSDINEMLDDCMSDNFRNKLLDSFNGGWVYSWHCMDHVGYSDNPRRKDVGFGNIFRFYREKIREMEAADEINWHYHPLSFDRNPLKSATSYVNNYDVLLEILCRRLIDENWFPIVNRPGFHTERPDIHMFLEQWIPFDYANQHYEIEDGQSDLINGRFGDWRRASSSWRGYQPDILNYQAQGACNRWIFRCLNLGTRHKPLLKMHVEQAFQEALSCGDAILAFANHDYRDIRPDVEAVQEMLETVRKDFPQVKFRYSGARSAATSVRGLAGINSVELEASIIEGRLQVSVVKGKIFGAQPFLAIKTVSGTYHHDNFDVQEFGSNYTYTFDSHTFPLENVKKISVAVNDQNGSQSRANIEF